MTRGKIQIQSITYWYQDGVVSDVFQKFMSKLVQDMNMLRQPF
jgi:hypothetical protein